MSFDVFPNVYSILPGKCASICLDGSRQIVADEDNVEAAGRQIFKCPLTSMMFESVEISARPRTSPSMTAVDYECYQ